MPNKTKKHIFCIDDAPEMLGIIEILLKDIAEVEVHQFTDAYAAFCAMERLIPDLIILDIMMPEINGLAAYEKIRSVDALKEVPVVFVTARSRASDLEQYRALGVPTICKPFTPVEFQDLMSMFL